MKLEKSLYNKPIIMQNALKIYTSKIEGCDYTFNVFEKSKESLEM